MRSLVHTVAVASPACRSITYWDTSDAKNEAPTYKALIADFEAKYPKIKVNYQNVDFTTVEQKFKAAAQSGKGAPDVIRTDVGLIPEYASLHYIAPLDGTPALTDTGDYLAGPLSTTKYDGKSYGAPSVTEAVRAGAEIYTALKSQLWQAGLSTGLGDEGGFAPTLETPEQACECRVSAIEAATRATQHRAHLHLEQAALLVL